MDKVVSYKGMKRNKNQTELNINGLKMKTNFNP